MAKGLQVSLVGSGRLPSHSQRRFVVAVPVQALPPGDELQAAEQKIEGVRPAWVVRLGVGVERPFGRRIALDHDEL